MSNDSMDGISKTLQALADPTRRKILQMLAEGDLQAGEIGAAFAITAPSVSHHLSVLKNADLVLAQRSGQNIIYSLNTTVMQEFMGQMMTLFKVGEDNERAE